MAYEFRKLSDAEVVETVSDAANVLIEENGVIKKVPKTEVGADAGNNMTVLVAQVMADEHQYIDESTVVYKETGIMPTAQEMWDAFKAGRIIVEYTNTYRDINNPVIVEIVSCNYTTQMGGVLLHYIASTGVYSSSLALFKIPGEVTI